MKQENNKNQPDVTRAKRTGSRKLKARKQPASFLPKNEWDFSSLFGRKDSALLRAAWLWEIDRETGTDQPPFLCLPKCLRFPFSPVVPFVRIATTLPNFVSHDSPKMNPTTPLFYQPICLPSLCFVSLIRPSY